MYASVMKWREGRASAIKGMVMPMVKRMGTCRASGKSGCMGETKQMKRTSPGEGCEEESGRRGTEKEEIFIQLGCTRAIDRLLKKSPERFSPAMERHL